MLGQVSVRPICIYGLIYKRPLKCAPMTHPVGDVSEMCIYPIQYDREIDDIQTVSTGLLSVLRYSHEPDC